MEGELVEKWLEAVSCEEHWTFVVEDGAFGDKGSEVMWKGAKRVHGKVVRVFDDRGGG